MPEVPTADAVGGAVLGISVIGDQIASVVRADDGRVIASNFVDLPDAAPRSVDTAITELISSVPMDVDRIGIAVADDEVREYLTRTFSGERVDWSNASWREKATVTDYPAALAEVGRAHAPRRGNVVVVDLDRDAAPAAGASVVIADVESGEIIGVADVPRGSISPITDQDGAAVLADRIAEMPGAAEVSSVVCTGSGAQVPGVAPAFEYAIQRPVTVADQPALAVAMGAADTAVAPVFPATAPVAAASSGRRWWFIGAAIGAAVVLGAIAITAVLAAERGVTDPVVQTSTIVSTPPPVTVTGKGATRTLTETRVQTETETVTRPPRTVTRTTTVTEQLPPVTVTVPGPPEPPESSDPGAG